MKLTAPLIFILSISASYTLAGNGSYKVDDTAVITNERVAQQHCSPHMLAMYKVNQSQCISAARKCLAKLETNKIDLEAEPMYHITCLTRELGISLPALSENTK
ncbi:hypothetical protein ACWJJH_02605 [Endozoicomonadaceae bacterium StTr2]